MWNKILPAIGTVIVIVVALVIADQTSGAVERWRQRKMAAKAAAADTDNGGAA